MRFYVDQVIRELDQDINRELLDFLDNPYSGEPSNVFLRFKVEGKPYNLYVTPTRRLGLAQRIRQ